MGNQKRNLDFVERFVILINMFLPPCVSYMTQYKYTNAHFIIKREGWSSSHNGLCLDLFTSGRHAMTLTHKQRSKT